MVRPIHSYLHLRTRFLLGLVLTAASIGRPGVGLGPVEIGPALSGGPTARAAAGEVEAVRGEDAPSPSSSLV